MTSEQKQRSLREIPTPQLSVEHWQPSDVPAIARLEAGTWAPWLRKPTQHLETIAERFPTTQLLVRDGRGDIAATVTANRVNWDGDPASLTTWDDVAGGEVAGSDYTATYVPTGNTLCLMSMNVDPIIQGERLAPKLLEGMRDVAKELGVQHLISSFRPSGFGDYKLRHGQISFEEYCRLTREDGEPLDPWLRSTSRLRMQPLRIEEQSMKVTVPLDTFQEYQQSYNPHKWKEVTEGRWECGETGTWTVQRDQAVYVEPNLWGEILIK